MGNKFNFTKSVFNPLKNMARPYVNDALTQLKTKGLDTLKQLGTQALTQLESTPIPVFKTGGRVSGKRGKARIAQLHGGEFVLPIGVAPTLSQKKAVAKRKAKARK